MQTTFEEVNDLNELIAERDNEMLRKAFDIYEDLEVICQEVILL